MLYHYGRKKTSDNWDNVCLRLQSTIKSIKDAGDEIEIVVAGHDKPVFLENNNDAVFLTVPFPIPVDKAGYMSDKESKKNVARRHILKNAKPNDLFMFIDADDIVSKKFISEVMSRFSKNPDVDDIALYSGFAFDTNRGKLAYLNGRSKVFYRNCGSCFISRIRDFDISESEEKNTFLFSLKDHTKYPEHSIRFGRSVLALFTPIVCYIVNHGSNDSNTRVGTDAICRFIDEFECHDEEQSKYFYGNFETSLLMDVK
ncbi:glycosyltransferase family A protein [Aeromonas jandaei]|uniref:glycosyltransferase family A protein n=1 Tax=Aeromonas jandaei TaxID=650 RepID=UPI0038D1B78B